MKLTTPDDMIFPDSRQNKMVELIEEQFITHKPLTNQCEGQYSVNFTIDGKYDPDDIKAVKELYEKEGKWWCVTISSYSGGTTSCHFTAKRPNT